MFVFSCSGWRESNPLYDTQKLFYSRFISFNLVILCEQILICRKFVENTDSSPNVLESFLLVICFNMVWIELVHVVF